MNEGSIHLDLRRIFDNDSKNFRFLLIHHLFDQSGNANVLALVEILRISIGEFGTIPPRDLHHESAWVGRRFTDIEIGIGRVTLGVSISVSANDWPHTKILVPETKLSV